MIFFIFYALGVVFWICYCVGISKYYKLTNKWPNIFLISLIKACIKDDNSSYIDDSPLLPLLISGILIWHIVIIIYWIVLFCKKLNNILSKIIYKYFLTKEEKAQLALGTTKKNDMDNNS